MSILPRCNAGLALLSSTSLWDFTAVFAQEFTACWYALFMESYLSLIMACAFFLLCLGFAKGGGVGAVSGERAEQQQAQRARNQRQQQRAQRQGSDVNGAGAATGTAPAAAAGAAGAAGKGSTSGSKQKRRSPVVGPLVKLRTGGASNQLLVAMLHTGAHLSLAIVLLLLLELGVETCIKWVVDTLSWGCVCTVLLLAQHRLTALQCMCAVLGLRLHFYPLLQHMLAAVNQVVVCCWLLLLRVSMHGAVWDLSPPFFLPSPPLPAASYCMYCMCTASPAGTSPWAMTVWAPCTAGLKHTRMSTSLTPWACARWHTSASCFGGGGLVMGCFGSAGPCLSASGRPRALLWLVYYVAA